MKTLISLFVFFVFSVSYGQKYLEDPKYGPDPETRQECLNNLSIMHEDVKIKMYDDAFNAWKWCFDNCPGASKNIYIDGVRIIKHKIENEADEQRKENLIDTLMLIYDRRIENFNEKGRILRIKGADLLYFRNSAILEAYGYMKEGIELTKEKPSGSISYTFIQASLALYKSAEITPEEFVGDYIWLANILSASESSRIENILERVDKIFAESGAADKEALVNIFSPKFEENPNDIELLKKITSLLARTDGGNLTELFVKAAENLYKLEPSADAAANIGSIFYSRGDYNKSKEYYLKALEQETDDEKTANYNYQIAVILNKQGKWSESKSYALKAIAKKSDFGRAYLLVGLNYAAGNDLCGEEFEKLAVYWAAIDKFIKAKQVDSSVTEKATEYINKYSNYFPTKEEAFFRNLQDGQSYKVECWINETTTVRTRK